MKISIFILLVGIIAISCSSASPVSDVVTAEELLKIHTKNNEYWNCKEATSVESTANFNRVDWRTPSNDYGWAKILRNRELDSGNSIIESSYHISSGQNRDYMVARLNMIAEIANDYAVSDRLSFAYALVSLDIHLHRLIGSLDEGDWEPTREKMETFAKELHMEMGKSGYQVERSYACILDSFIRSLYRSDK